MPPDWLMDWHIDPDPEVELDIEEVINWLDAPSSDDPQSHTMNRLTHYMLVLAILKQEARIHKMKIKKAITKHQFDTCPHRFLANFHFLWIPVVLVLLLYNAVYIFLQFCFSIEPKN